MDRPTLRQLEYAVAVDEFRSFSKAAVACQVSQPGLSAQVAELERRLGVALFERTRSATTPTPAGEEVLGRARAILRSVDDLLHVTDVHRDTVAGVLRVAAIPTMAPYLLSTVAHQLRRLWPDVRLELSELRTSALVEAVDNAHVDIGVLATPVDTASLRCVDLAFDPFVLAVAESSALAGLQRIAIERLADHEILLLEDGHCLREHALAACTLAGTAHHREVHHTGLSVLAQMVAASDATTLLPTSAVSVEARPGSGLAVVPLDRGDIGRTVSAVWRPSDPRSGLYERAMARIAPVVSSLLDT